MFWAADSHDSWRYSRICLAWKFLPSTMSKVEHLLLSRCGWQPAAHFCLYTFKHFTAPRNADPVWLSLLCRRHRWQVGWPTAQFQVGTTSGVSAKPPHNHKATNLLHRSLNPYVGSSFTSSARSIRTSKAVVTGRRRKGSMGKAQTGNFLSRFKLLQLLFPTFQLHRAGAEAALSPNIIKK